MNCHLEDARQEESEPCLGQAPCVVPAALRMLPCAPHDEERTALLVPLCALSVVAGASDSLSQECADAAAARGNFFVQVSHLSW